MNFHMMKAGFKTGTTTRMVLQNLHRVRAASGYSYQRALKLASHAGASLGTAGRIGLGSTGADVVSVSRTIHASNAFNAQIQAEGERWRTAYLQRAADAWKATHDALQAAYALGRHKSSRNEAAIDEWLKKAAHRSDVAVSLEQAANAAYEAASKVPEPGPVAQRTVVANAAKAGLKVGSQDVSFASPLAKIDPRKVSPLMADFYPADVVRASGALSGLGDAATESNPDWLSSVKAALGMGATAASSAAQTAAYQTTNDPAAKAALTAAGGAAAALATLLGANFTASSQVQRPVDTQSSFPWGLVVGGSAVAVGALLLLRKVI